MPSSERSAWRVGFLCSSQVPPLVKPGEDFEEPLMMITGPLVYCIFANICYTFGWIVDAVFYMGTPRTRLYKSGLIFSVVLTALPGVWAVMAWLITVYTGRKLD
jgi:hypothetical protein